jgi:dTMP kinase
MYVIIEGIDTSGKSTQIELLKNKFKNAVFTKEPGGTGLGVKIRQMLLEGHVQSTKAELFLFLADRAELFEEIIKPNLNNLIISDRGFVSGIAYAMSNHIKVDFDEFLKLNALALDGNFPDIVFLLRVDKKTILQRLGRKEQDNIEKRGIEYLLDVQKNMQNIIKKINTKYIEIDASKSIDEIHKEIVKNIGERL